MKFMTTPEQDYILSILKATKVMRKSQAIKLLNKLDSSRNELYWERFFGQLGHIRKIAWLSDDLFTVPFMQRSPVDEDMLQAIDIMLDLTEKRIHALSSSTPPYKLCFLAEQKQNLGSYAIIAVRHGVEAAITAALRDSAQDDRTIVFLLSDISQATCINTSLPHFFAVTDGNKYRYSSGGRHDMQ